MLDYLCVKEKVSNITGQKSFLRTEELASTQRLEDAKMG